MTDQADSQGPQLSEGLGAWVRSEDRLPEDGQSVAFVVRASHRLDYMNGKVLGGYFRAGPFGGFGVPGMTVDAWYWMPLPPAPEVPAAPEAPNVGGEVAPCGTGLTKTTTATPQGVASTD